MSRGGAFCRFVVGRLGNSCRHLRYISRRDAVRDLRQGVFLRNLPRFVQEQRDYTTMVRVLCHHARLAESKEILTHRARGAARTHYCVTLSFEREMTSHDAGVLVQAWLDRAFPLAPSATFLHRNTGHLHAHVWIGARQTDGAKINLSARAFRQLDEIWNEIYAHAVGGDERTYLLRKWETEHYKRLRREGKAPERPERAAHSWHPAQFTQRERKRLGADYEREESGTRSDQPETARGTGQQGRSPVSSGGGSAGTGRGQSVPDHASVAVQGAVESSEHAVSETHTLHQEAARLAGLERKIEGMERDIDDIPERER